MTDLESLFQKEMLSLHERWKNECNYNATVFIKIVNQHGGLNAAKILLGGQGLSRGFLKLMALQRLDLTMENLVIQPRWSTLFTGKELEIARSRLEEGGFFKFKDPSAKAYLPVQQGTPTENVLCPKCNSSMVLRTSKEGKQFYGCSKFPPCKGTRSVK